LVRSLIEIMVAVWWQMVSTRRTQAHSGGPGFWELEYSPPSYSSWKRT